MSDSSIDDDLFGNNVNEQQDKLNELQNDLLANYKSGRQSVGAEQKIASFIAPAHVESNDFKNFVKENQVTVNNKYGYICVFLSREFYFPGQTVRGFALIDLFNDIPSKDIMIRVKGREIPAKHGEKIAKKLVNEPDLFHMESISNRLMTNSSRFMIKPQSIQSQASGNMNEIKFIQAAANEQGNSGSQKLVPQIMLPPKPLEIQLPDDDINVGNTQPIPREINVIEVHDQQKDKFSQMSQNQNATNSSHGVEMNNLTDQRPDRITPQNNALKNDLLFKPSLKPTIGNNFIENAKILKHTKTEIPSQSTGQRKSVAFLNPNSLISVINHTPSNKVHQSKPQDQLLSQESGNIDGLVSSALVLSRKKVSRKEEVEQARKSIPLLDCKLKAFTFKDQTAKKGQYRLPFSFKLPSNIPGSFKFSQSNKGEDSRIIIEYTVEVSIEVLTKDHQELLRLSHKKEIDVREYLFTDEEIEEDWNKYQQIMDLKKVLRPNNIMGSGGHSLLKANNLDENGQEIKFSNLNKMQNANGNEDDQQNNLSLKKIVRDTNKQNRREVTELSSLKLRLNQMMTEQQHGISNNQWYMDQVITSTRCLCFKSSYTMRIRAELNKQLFYPDEKVRVQFDVDNSHSDRDIKEIRCSLKHDITIRKAKQTLLSISNTLFQIDHQGITSSKKEEKQEFVFDLNEIFTELKRLWQESHNAPKKLRSSLLNPGASLWESGIQSFRQKETAQTNNNTAKSTQSQKVFNKYRMKLIEEVEQCTFYTVHGISIVSDFTIELAIVVSDLLGETTHERSFPFTIRSRKNGDFINDLDSLGAYPVITSVNRIMDNLRPFLPEMPVSLPGCNFNTREEEEQENNYEE